MIHKSDVTFTKGPIETICKGAFSTASTVQLLWKGDNTFQTIFNAVKEAQSFICLEFYIFRNDDTGAELAQLLKQKSREGVRIYLLYDHFGSIGTPGDFWKDMRHAGIKINVSYPFKPTAPLRYVHRDHKKLIVIDSCKAFTGGLNIANEYSGFHLRWKGRGWRDTGIMLEGPIVGELFRIFKKSWYAWGGGPMEEEYADCLHSSSAGYPSLAASSSEIPAIPMFVKSAKGRRRMRGLLYYSINHSRECISLTTAYFTPSWRLVEILEEAVQRGVRVRLLVPGISDVPAASYAGRAFFSRLLDAGVEIYTYMGEILHAKTYIFDNCWSIVGSSNLDFQSLRYNDEGSIGILHNEFTAKLSDIFEEDLKHSLRIDRETWHRRPLLDKMKEHFFSLFRRRL